MKIVCQECSTPFDAVEIGVWVAKVQDNTDVDIVVEDIFRADVYKCKCPNFILADFGAGFSLDTTPDRVNEVFNMIKESGEKIHYYHASP